MFEGYGPASWSMLSPGVIIVEGVPAQPAAAAHYGAYRWATNAGGGWGSGHTGKRRDLSLRKGSAFEP